MEFKLPMEYQGVDEQEILQRMLDKAPPHIDKAEGHMLYDHLAPVAAEIGHFINFEIPLAIQAMFPQFAEGYMLDLHADATNIVRRDAGPAYGQLTIKGTPNTTIPKGTLFHNSPSDGEDILYFKSTDDVTLDDEGTGYVDVVATVGGRKTNASEFTVTEYEHREIKQVYNEYPFIGGADIEGDESLRKRVLEAIRSADGGGNVADYKKWAREVDGVGNVEVIPVWKGPKTVRVIISADDGGEAPDELVKKVQQHIDPAEETGQGLGKAPIGAHVQVDSVKYQFIDVGIKAVLNTDYNATLARKHIEKALNDYMQGKQEIRYNVVIGVLVHLDAISDLIDLTLDGKKENVKIIELDKVPTVGELVIYEQTT